MSRATDALTDLSPSVDAVALLGDAAARYVRDWDIVTFLASIVAAGSLVQKDLWPGIRTVLEELGEVEEVAHEDPARYARVSLWAGFLAGIATCQAITVGGMEKSAGLALDHIRLIENQIRASRVASGKKREHDETMKAEVSQCAARVLYRIAEERYRRTGEISAQDRPQKRRLAKLVLEEFEESSWNEPPTLSSLERRYFKKDWLKEVWDLICKAVKNGKTLKGLGL